MASRTSGAECAFSPNGQYFAHISADGRLKIWECDSARPKQEFLPSAHLSATCTCLVWAPLKQAEQGLNRKKKKRKATGEEKQNHESESVAGSDIIALGTASGTILLYSLNRAELIHQLNGAHSDKIHSLCWNDNGSSLFSAAADRKIIEWDIVKGVAKSQWKCDKGPVYRVCMLSDNKTLVTGGRSIHCWNTETRKVVATFSGHSTNIVNLVPVSGGKGGYFLSAAEGDRSVCAWKYAEKESSNRCVATFSLQDDLACLTISRPASDEEPMVLGAVSLSGILHVFEHQLNGWVKKPLEPKVKIHIGCDSAGNAKPLPILAAFACGDIDGHCIIVYGSVIKPAIEKICYRSQENQTYLVRKDPLAVHQKSEATSAMKTRTPIVPNDVKTLAPEYLLPANVANDTGRKRRNANSESNAGPTKDSLPMEQRLSALNLDKTTDSVAPPQADNLAQLLLQGLQSRDPKILQGVLDRGEVQIISNTVRRLPVQAVLPLLHELTRFMQFKGHPSHSYAKWLQSILEHHAGYLTSCPDLSTALTPLLAIMTARTRLFPKMSQLQGRLNLMLGELEHRSEKKDSSAAAVELPATALLVYREESSDEASEDGDWPLQSGSESDDQWDELSDNGEAMDVNETKEESDLEEDLDNEDEEDQIDQSDSEENDLELEESILDEDEDCSNLEEEEYSSDDGDDQYGKKNSFLDDEAEEDFNAFLDEGTPSDIEDDDDEDRNSASGLSD